MEGPVEPRCQFDKGDPRRRRVTVSAEHLPHVEHEREGEPLVSCPHPRIVRIWLVQDHASFGVSIMVRGHAGRTTVRRHRWIAVATAVHYLRAVPKP